MPPDVVVLLSMARHPVSGRPCAARLDAAALELALRCVDRPLAVHAGDPANPVLGDYLGMGVSRLLVLDAPLPEDDILQPLVNLLADRKPGILLCGMQSESGESSGMLPYLLAKRLNMPLIANVASLAIEAGEVVVSQAVSGGRRRRLAVDLPVILTVGAAGPKPRQWAYAKARRGHIEAIATAFLPDTERSGWIQKEARQRPRKLRAGTVAETADGGALIGLSPRQAAERLHAFLVERGILKE